MISFRTKTNDRPIRANLRGNVFPQLLSTEDDLRPVGGQTFGLTTIMKKREERDDRKACARVQPTVRCLVFVRSRGSCECDKTSPPPLRCESNPRPFAAL